MATSSSRRAWRAQSGPHVDLRALVVAALVLAVATGVAALLAQVLMAPGVGDLSKLTLYLIGSGVVTLTLGRIALRRADAAVGLNLRAKSFVSVAVGIGVALLNVLIVAQLMFLSTDHDLPLLMALLVFAAVITVLLAQWVAASVTSRLQQLAEGARALAGGDFGVRVDAASRDEVADLAATFNEMAERLQRAETARAEMEQERRYLTMAVSHDLRTPVSSLRAMVEALNDQVVSDPAEVSRYYDAMLRELKRLGSLMDDLFELARIESGAIQLQLREVAPGHIVTEAADAMQPLAHRRKVSLALSLEQDVPPLHVDPDCISRVLLNLLQNALDHTPAGGRVEIRLEPRGREAVFRVVDTGGGIPPEDLPHIWKPFYRGEKSRRRSAEDGGAGLGLAIVKGLVEAHGGTVAATSQVGRGTEITVALPV